jgi:ABC-type spermidine/putrescine transport system permease subunit II
MLAMVERFQIVSVNRMITSLVQLFLWLPILFAIKLAYNEQKNLKRKK